MFAVPGWDLTRLQTQKAHDTAQPGESTKKRKREPREEGIPHVTQSNVASLWTQHVERSEGTANTSKSIDTSQQGDEREKLPGSSLGADSGLTKGRPNAIVEDGTPSSRRREKKRKTRKPGLVPADSNRQEEKRKTVDDTPIARESEARLTPMQAAMRQKLVSARFRYLNQTLYTSPSGEARALFDSNPTFFHEYHAGFRQQVSSWPENPVDSYIEELKDRCKAQGSGRSKPRAGQEKAQSKGRTAPLSRNNGVCTVADMGCGDGRLASQLGQQQESQGLHILSYDLYSSNSLVTKSDISSLPLEDGSLDVAILCLALMGTNWVSFVEEAWRILRWKGELWIAEIKSRFGRAKKRRVDHSVGRRKKAGTQSVQADRNDDQDHLRTQVDGSESSQGQTDVSAFVKVLERRGFALQTDEAVDMSNKMFVKLRFSKSKTPTKGKHSEQGPTSRQSGNQQSAAHLKHLDEDEDLDEASVLKPCLYKIR